MNVLVVFPTFINVSLNLAIRSSWSEPQSAPGLVFADCLELLHLWLQRISSVWFHCWQSGDVHVYSLLLCCWSEVQSSLVVVWRGCLLWPVCSLGKTLLALALLHSVLQKPNLPVTPGVSWLPTFAFQSPIMKRTFLGGVSSKRPCRSS